VLTIGVHTPTPRAHSQALAPLLPAHQGLRLGRAIEHEAFAQEAVGSGAANGQRNQSQDAENIG
jgi:hypothetical protein